MKELLIIGNRNPNEEFIKNWKGDTWGFNDAYKKYKVDLILGDYSSIIEAIDHKKETGKKFDIYANGVDNLCKETFGNMIKYFDNTKFIFVNFPGLLIQNALDNKYEKIYITGLELDITSYKNSWQYNLYNLSKIYENFFDIVEFIDNSDYEDLIKNVLLGGFTKEFINSSVLILGNGISRKDYYDEKEIKRFSEDTSGDIWGCNQAYTEDIPFSRLGSLHLDMAQEMLKFKNKYGKNWEIYSLKEKLPDIKKFQYAHRGGNTGYQWILQALYEKYDFIYLIGFDFGGYDIYTETKTGRTFQNRFLEIIEEFGLNKIYFYNGLPNFLC